MRYTDAATNLVGAKAAARYGAMKLAWYFGLSGIDKLSANLEEDLYTGKPADTLTRRAVVSALGRIGLNNEFAQGFGDVAELVPSWLSPIYVFRTPALVPRPNFIADKATFGTRFARFFWDNREWRIISREYWDPVLGRGPANGRSLDHWLFARTPNTRSLIGRLTAKVPAGLRNAGFNLVELPPFVETSFGGLNQWMGMSRSPWAKVARVGVTLAIPSSLVVGGYVGTKLGEWLWDLE
jgi:hypothetical protein